MIAAEGQTAWLPILDCQPRALAPKNRNTPMGDVVNLNQYRKQRKRKAEERAARTNRVQRGLTKAERERLRLADRKQADDIDGKKLIDPEDRESENPEGHSPDKDRPGPA